MRAETNRLQASQDGQGARVSLGARVLLAVQRAPPARVVLAELFQQLVLWDSTRPGSRSGRAIAGLRPLRANCRFPPTKHSRC